MNRDVDGPDYERGEPSALEEALESLMKSRVNLQEAMGALVSRLRPITNPSPQPSSAETSDEVEPKHSAVVAAIRREEDHIYAVRIQILGLLSDLEV